MVTLTVLLWWEGSSQELILIVQRGLVIWIRLATAAKQYKTYYLPNLENVLVAIEEDKNVNLPSGEKMGGILCS